MPFLIGLCLRADFRAHATDAARLVLSRPALQLVWGWTKSFPVSIGRPGLRVIVAGDRDRRLRPAAARVRVDVGRDRAPRGAMLVSTVVVLRCLGGRAAPSRAAPACAARPEAVAREGPRRLGDLAAGRRRPGVHAPEVAAFLRARGHDVEVVITADAEPAPRGLPRALGARGRCRRASATLRRCGCSSSRARGARTSSTRPGCSAAPRSGRSSARTPFVDQAHRRPGVRARAPLGSQRRLARGVPARGRRASTLPLRLARDVDVRRAAHVVTPSAYLRELAIGWGVPADRVTLLPNPAPPLPELAPREELRARFGFDGPTLVFAGRLTAQKSLDARDRGGAPARASRS